MAIIVLDSPIWIVVDRALVSARFVLQNLRQPNRIVGLNRDHVFLSQLCKHFFVPEAIDSKTEAPCMLPQQAARDENACPGHLLSAKSKTLVTNPHYHHMIPRVCLILKFFRKDHSYIWHRRFIVLRNTAKVLSMDIWLQFLYLLYARILKTCNCTMNGLLSYQQNRTANLNLAHLAVLFLMPFMR